MTDDESDAIQYPDGKVDLVLPDNRYGFVGVDGEGWHHHYDEQEEKIYVTSEPSIDFVPDGTVLYHYRITGDVDVVVLLSRIGDLNLDDWIAFVDKKRGWEHLAENPILEVLKEMNLARTLARPGSQNHIHRRVV